MSITTKGPAPEATQIMRADWVDARLVRTFMSNVRATLLLATCIIPIIAFVLWGEVSTAALLIWAGAACAVSLVRLHVLVQFRRSLGNAGGPELRRFMSRHGWTWPLSAIVWGSAAFVYLDRAPLRSQFVCLVVVVGMGAMAVGTLSAHLRIFRAYASALCLTLLAALVWNSYLASGGRVPDTDDHALILLTLIFWSVLLAAGLRFHQVQRQSFELQFDNSRLIASLTDQTQSALEAVQTKNRLLANAAHDLRQPVHALSLYADWLRNEPDLSAEITPKIVEATRAVNQLFDSLFDLARLERGELTVKTQRIEVNDLLDELAVQYAPLAQNKGLALRVRGPHAGGVLASDRILLQRVLGNLLSNAIRYTERGGVLLAARRRRSGWMLEVWDTGVGIAQDAQSEIFREFYRIERHAGTQEGFGLGLAIVRRLSDALGHEITLQSREGRGTVFRLLVPAAGADVAAPGAGHPVRTQT